MLTHSATLHTAQSRGFDQTLATATAKLAVLGDTLARGHTRRSRDKVTAEITQIINDPGCAGSCPGSSPVTPQPSTA